MCQLRESNSSFGDSIFAKLNNYRIIDLLLMKGSRIMRFKTILKAANEVWKQVNLAMNRSIEQLCVPCKQGSDMWRRGPCHEGVYEYARAYPRFVCLEYKVLMYVLIDRGQI